MSRAYYNEIDPYAAQWLRNLIAGGHIAPGDVDERSIVDVRPADLVGYAQCHFFAGIGGWSYAARLAGWPDDKPLWTGSCPCQPFSVAGKQAGQADERHLWPVLFDLIRDCKPTVVMGEQVAAAVGKDWLDGVHSDMEAIGYACGAAVVPACAVNAPHRRDRLWFVAHTDRAGLSQRECEARDAGEDRGRAEGQDTAHDDPAMAHAAGARRGQVGRASAGDMEADRGRPGNWNGNGGSAYVAGADGKARRVEPGISLLAHGVPARVGKLRAYGNAIVPQVAAEVIGAFLDIERAAA
jgi:DNA (cytosine-5)-methyltransferase 1